MGEYLVVATHDFSARTETELSFKKGDILRISDKDRPDPGWLFARLGSAEGNLPQTYVSGQVTRAIALYNYKAQQEHELSFRKGDLLTVIRKYPKSDWWEGAKSNQTSGMFPTNYVKVIFDAQQPSPDEFEQHEQAMQAKISQKKQQRQLEVEKRRNPGASVASPVAAGDNKMPGMPGGGSGVLTPEGTRRGPPIDSYSERPAASLPRSPLNGRGAPAHEPSDPHNNIAPNVPASSAMRTASMRSGGIGGRGPVGGGAAPNDNIVAEQKRMILDLKSKLSAQDMEVAQLKRQLEESRAETRRMNDELRTARQGGDQVRQLELKLVTLQQSYDHLKQSQQAPLTLSGTLQIKMGGSDLDSTRTFVIDAVQKL